MGMKTKATEASLRKDPASPFDEERKEEKEEIATHLGRGNLLTVHFTMANNTLGE